MLAADTGQNLMAVDSSAVDSMVGHLDNMLAADTGQNHLVDSSAVDCMSASVVLGGPANMDL